MRNCSDFDCPGYAPRDEPPPHESTAVGIGGWVAIGWVLASVSWLAAVPVFAEEHMPRPGDDVWPVAWSKYGEVSREADFADLVAHGVTLISMDARDVAGAREALAAARRHGMRYHLSIPDITEAASVVREADQEVVDAVMLGGVFRGKAMDKHLFSFPAGPQRIIIEPPVYAAGYVGRLGARGNEHGRESFGHYFPDIPAPLRAEVIVPLAKFDGRQHWRILPATIRPAPAGAVPVVDSITPDMPATAESRGRKLYELSFDLTGLEGALLDHVGLAVYWPYHGTRQYGALREGIVSAAAPATQEALRWIVRQRLAVWTEANDGRFPADVVIAARFGDEKFYPTGHQGASAVAVNFPLWDFSAPAIAAFRELAGRIEYPRTWGFPEVYGADAYACWQYNLHAQAAGLAGIVRKEVSRFAPGLIVFRNTTRFGVFSLGNDHDGSGPELLTRNLDIVHLDPYPIKTAGYDATTIPRDMSYYAGLARRYGRPLVPWMQSFTNVATVGTRVLTPEYVDRMMEQQLRQGIDAVMWLGYGRASDIVYAFPQVAPAAWERAGVFHHRLIRALPSKPSAELAVLRPYATWALSSLWEGRIRNPADWMLQQWLEVWAVKHELPYDVFEVPPRMTETESNALDERLSRYAHVVTTLPRAGAWVIEPAEEAVETKCAAEFQKQYEAEMIRRGWYVAFGRPNEGK